ncbi:MAG: microcystin degradation protein MlrC, partial [Armatimonadetes bacterium]|nr:microcystin degradation protein MlrC [Armatimonadota bacterium]
LRAAPPADGCYFSLHGAMAAEGEDDPEGYLLQEARRILGERVPIVVSLDLHGILTDRMLQHSDAVVVYRTYPHVDFRETGERAAHLLLRILDGDARPVTATVRVPALVRGDELITETGLIRHVIEAAKEIEASGGGLSAGMFWGNPFTDVRDLRSNSLVVTDGDPARAAREAVRLADLFWQHHERMQVPLTTLAESVRIAKSTEGTVILVDAADATSSGASGDSNALLRALVEGGYQGRSLVPIVDPPAVEAAFAAGVGGSLEVSVGGALDPKRFQPLPVSGVVRMLSDGRFRSESFGGEWYGGNTAVLECGPHTLVLTTRPVSLYDRSLFYAHGQDPRRFDAVVVKSPHCQPHMFKEWCARYVDVDAPGSTSANLRSLGHTRCARPMFPLDEVVPFEPAVRVFSRQAG